MPSPTSQNDPFDPRGPNSSGVTDSPARVSQPGTRQRRQAEPGTGSTYLLFGAVEDLLADFTAHGAPDAGVVHIERLVRNKADSMGGTATLGIAITARREDEILSAWVIVGRLALDPWGQPLDRERAVRAAERHRDAQHLIGALFADAGFDVRLGLYLLPEGCYGLAATCEALTSSNGPHSASPTQPSGARDGGEHVLERAYDEQSPEAHRHVAEGEGGDVAAAGGGERDVESL